jgi:hypothetical protein
MQEHTINNVKFTDADVINPNDLELYATGSNPHNVRCFLLHDHGFSIGVAIAESLQDALDEAADAGKLDSFEVQEEDFDNYGMRTDSPTCSFLGNYCKGYDVEAVSAIEFGIPRLSLCALLNASD